VFKNGINVLIHELESTCKQRRTIEGVFYRTRSREKVDEIVNTAVSLGGKSHEEPEDYGFMYHWAFEDLDGHMWAINYINTDEAQG
jgi:predicted lactoylglutathione lyase